MTAAQQWSAAVMAHRSTSHYAVVTLSAAPDAPRARAGSYASVRIGGPESSFLMRRPLWIREASAGGRHGGSIDVVVDLADPAASWLVSQQTSARVDVIGPVGRPFSLPGEPVSCVLVGFGAATAPLIRLAEDLMARGCSVTFLMLGPQPGYGVVEARRHSSHLVDATGTDSDWGGVLRQAVAEADVLYSAGPAESLREVVTAVQGRAIVHQAAVALDLVCGSGTCTACAIPIHGRDGITRMVRACAEGPVFNADLVRWADLGTVPGDCLGSTHGAVR